MIPAAASLAFALWGVNVQFPETVMTQVEQGLRWVHFVAGITWVGLLYFFILVNQPLMKELDAATRGKVAPKLMSRVMWWFRWAGVVTVLVGLLYFILYMMRDAQNAGEPALAWKWLGWWFLVWVGAWAVMYLVMRRPMNGWLVGIAGLAVFSAASWMVLALLGHPAASNRVLSISVGGGMGLVMLLNVWGVVWRAQKRLIVWTAANAEHGTPMPEEAAQLARLAFLAAHTNFWLSFPLLFFMAASSHYPFLSGR